MRDAIAIIFILYTLSVDVLDWTGRMEIIERRFPGVRKIILGQRTRLLLVLVAVLMIASQWYEAKESKSEKAAQGSNEQRSSGSATTSGSKSPANTGDGNSFVYPDENPNTRNNDKMHR